MLSHAVARHDGGNTASLMCLKAQTNPILNHHRHMLWRDQRRSLSCLHPLHSLD